MSPLRLTTSLPLAPGNVAEARSALARQTATKSVTTRVLPTRTPGTDSCAKALNVTVLRSIAAPPAHRQTDVSFPCSSLRLRSSAPTWSYQREILDAVPSPL